MFLQRSLFFYSFCYVSLFYQFSYNVLLFCLQTFILIFLQSFIFRFLNFFHSLILTIFHSFILLPMIFHSLILLRMLMHLRIIHVRVHVRIHICEHLHTYVCVCVYVSLRVSLFNLCIACSIWRFNWHSVLCDSFISFPARQEKRVVPVYYFVRSLGSDSIKVDLLKVQKKAKQSIILRTSTDA